MRTGQAWVFLEVGLGIVFVVTMFCLCRYFDLRKARRRLKREKAADENCYQRQLAEQRERALSIRKESLRQMGTAGGEARQALTSEERPAGQEEDEEAAKKAGTAAADAAAAEGEKK